MNNVIQFPQTTEQLWEAYAAILKRANDDPRLLSDRHHCEAQVRAWKAFHDAFCKDIAA